MRTALAQLERAAGAMGLTLPAGALEQYGWFLREVLEWRRRINLTGAASAGDLIAFHVVDSLLPLAVVNIRRGAALADIGSGAGFPGVPVKIARPDLGVALVEASRRRVAFLEHVVRGLNLDGLRVVGARAEALARQPEFRERFDVVISRALARTGVSVELCLPLAAPGGTVVLLKGPSAARELAEVRPLIERLGGELEPPRMRALPTTDRARLVAVIAKRRPTGAEFPRRRGRLGR